MAITNMTSSAISLISRFILLFSFKMPYEFFNSDRFTCNGVNHIWSEVLYSVTGSMHTWHWNKKNIKKGCNTQSTNGSYKKSC